MLIIFWQTSAAECPLYATLCVLHSCHAIGQIQVELETTNSHRVLHLEGQRQFLTSKALGLIQVDGIVKHHFYDILETSPKRSLLVCCFATFWNIECSLRITILVELITTDVYRLFHGSLDDCEIFAVFKCFTSYFSHSRGKGNIREVRTT